MARFGVTAPLVSTVIAVFMAGSRLGSVVAAGLGAQWRGASHARAAVRAAEIGIAALGAKVCRLSRCRPVLAGRGGLGLGSGRAPRGRGGFVALALLPSAR